MCTNGRYYFEYREIYCFFVVEIFTFCYLKNWPITLLSSHNYFPKHENASACCRFKSLCAYVPGPSCSWDSTSFCLRLMSQIAEFERNFPVISKFVSVIFSIETRLWSMNSKSCHFLMILIKIPNIFSVIHKKLDHQKMTKKSSDFV